MLPWPKDTKIWAETRYQPRPGAFEHPTLDWRDLARDFIQQKKESPSAATITPQTAPSGVGIPSFPLFPTLPKELREEIWKYALPGPRVLEVSYVTGAPSGWVPIPVSPADVYPTQPSNTNSPALYAEPHEVTTQAVEEYSDDALACAYIYAIFTSEISFSDARRVLGLARQGNSEGRSLMYTTPEEWLYLPIKRGPVPTWEGQGRGSVNAIAAQATVTLSPKTQMEACKIQFVEEFLEFNNLAHLRFALLAFLGRVMYYGDSQQIAHGFRGCGNGGFNYWRRLPGALSGFRTTSGYEVPRALHVNRESRKVAQKHYELALGAATTLYQGYSTQTTDSWTGLANHPEDNRIIFAPPRTYIDYTIDTVFLSGTHNWYQAHDTISCLTTTDRMRLRHFAIQKTWAPPEINDIGGLLSTFFGSLKSFHLICHPSDSALPHRFRCEERSERKKITNDGSTRDIVPLRPQYAQMPQYQLDRRTLKDAFAALKISGQPGTGVWKEPEIQLMELTRGGRFCCELENRT